MRTHLKRIFRSLRFCLNAFVLNPDEYGGLNIPE